MLHKMSIGHKTKWILRNLNLFIASPNFLESYMCYTPNMPYKNQPWLWQFIAQMNSNGSYCVPTSHEWIIFKKR